MGIYHPAAESKARPKVNPKYQQIVIADGQTAPAAGNYVFTQHMDVVGVETDSAFDGTKITWYGARTKELADAGTWVAVKFEGTAVESTVGASGHDGVDPVKLASYLCLRPVSDAAQSGADTTVGVLLRDFTRS